ncbi:MAG: diacylglycerol kinase family protein [Parcubacteria group bacterium]|nr:diacylglycerol kinase family protein [Parcubacteria group bacterium]
MVIKIQKTIDSFHHAFDGLKIAFHEEQSFRIQLFVAAIVVILMYAFPVHSIEKAILFLAIGFVLGLELLNSQLEGMLDMWQPSHDPRIKKIKDLSSSAVLIASIASTLVGLYIFIPYFF